MIKVDNELKRAGLQAGLLLQVHDELLLSAPRSEAAAAKEILRQTMIHAVELPVPLEVTLSSGTTYADC